ncbi:hypothetical protein [Streptosporangium sp. NPDC006007]|uniref:hypothetical protein n=1 Tax=Streptosporangium sp. NPDC006007 TaxID=3154575 RepID=UPI00339E1B14
MNTPVNPFPMTPAVLLGDFHALTTVRTESVTLATDYVTDYLDYALGAVRRAETVGRGRCLAITGKLGAGKSHLLGHLSTRLPPSVPADPAMPGVHAFTIGGPFGRFLTIYREKLITALDREEFSRIVQVYHADATVRMLKRLNASEEIIAPVRDLRTPSWQVARRYHLSEDEIRRNMHERLREVIDTDDLAAHLSLLDFPENPGAIWEWLNCKAPDQALIERGIDEPIDSDAKAFTAFAMLTFLYGRAGRPFALVIDELEKMMQETGDSPSWHVETLQAFERLVNVFIDTGGLIVLCVLPESLRKFSGGLYQRVLVQPVSPFTRADTVKLIKEYVDADAPVWFSPSAMYAVADLSDGNPRLILDLCRRTWDLACRPDRRVEITPEMVRRAIRAKFEAPRSSIVSGEVRQVLEANGWVYDSPDEDDEFHVPRGTKGAAITVLIIDSLLHDAALNRAVRRIEGILASADGQEVIVVVNGYLRAGDRMEISRKISRQPMAFDHHLFRENLQSQLLEAHRLLEEAGHETVWESIRDEVLRVGAQQTYTQSMVERLAADIEWLRGPMGAGLLSSAVPDARERLPAEVRGHFDRAFRAVETLSGVGSLFDDTFLTPRQGPPPTRPRRLASRELFESAGVAMVFHKLLQAFVEAVASWLDTVTRFPSAAAEQQIERLRGICHCYEVTAEVLPLARLAAFESGRETTGLAEQGARSSQRREAVDALTNLGLRVQESVLAEAGLSPLP